MCYLLWQVDRVYIWRAPGTPPPAPREIGHPSDWTHHRNAGDAQWQHLAGKYRGTYFIANTCTVILFKMFVFYLSPYINWKSNQQETILSNQINLFNLFFLSYKGIFKVTCNGDSFIEKTAVSLFCVLLTLFFSFQFNKVVTGIQMQLLKVNRKFYLKDKIVSSIYCWVRILSI